MGRRRGEGNISNTRKVAFSLRPTVKSNRFESCPDYKKYKYEYEDYSGIRRIKTRNS
jgi:hypothetical protein